MNEIVYKSAKGNPVTNSKVIAEKFGKNHKDVLRAIRGLECSDDFHKRNFAPMFYTSTLGNGGKRQDSYTIMTRDGFTFLVMGFTGKEAAQFKEQFIEAFNKMEIELKQLTILPNFSNPAEAARAWAEQYEQKQIAEDRVKQLSPKAELADRLIDTETRVDIGQAAKLLKLPFGRNTFFKSLREIGIFFKARNEPKQEYIERGYFQLFMTVIPTQNHGDLSVTKIIVTQKGLSWLAKTFDTTYNPSLPKLNAF